MIVADDGRLPRIGPGSLETAPVGLYKLTVAARHHPVDIPGVGPETCQRRALLLERVTLVNVRVVG